MTTGAVQKTTRGVSPILLVLAALCFLLPFVGVSCNTGAAQSALGPALQSLGGTGAQATQAQQCLQNLSNRDLATYTGINLAFGGNPKADTSNIPGCDTGDNSSANVGGDQGSIGLQPLMLAAFILIIVGVLATILRAPWRNVVAAAAALVAAALVVINNSNVHTPIINKIGSSSGGSLSQVGITGGLGGFFDIHAAIGFTLVLVALGLAVLVNAGAAALGMRAPVTTAGVAGAPPGSFNWPSDTGSAGAPGAPPPA